MSQKQAVVIGIVFLLSLGGGLALATSIHRIVSGEEAEQRQLATLQAHCQDRPASNACLGKYVIEEIQTEGLAAGFAMMKVWYTHAPEFRPVCDVFTRYLGAAVYAENPDYTTLTYTEESVWCNYGFYHGYMGASMAAESDLAQGAAFCSYVGEQLKTRAPGAQSECFRALGYAIVLRAAAEEKNTKTIAETSVRMCADRSQTPLDLRLCEEGVFSQLGQIIARGDYGLVSKENPLWLCDEQPSDRQNLCYATMKWLPYVSLGVKEQDITTGFNILKTHYREEEMRELSKTIEQLIFTFAYGDARRGTALPAAESYERGIRACAALPTAFIKHCIRGFGLGLAKGGMPGEMHTDVLAFCKMTASIPDYLMKDCAHSSMEYFERYYPRETFARICEEFEAALGTSCTR